jgi:hypothetical protein
LSHKLQQKNGWMALANGLASGPLQAAGFRALLPFGASETMAAEGLDMGFLRADFGVLPLLAPVPVPVTDREMRIL